MTRLYGRAAPGERVVDHTPHGHWKTITLLAGLRLDGPMAPMVVPRGGTDTDVFTAYVEQVLVGALRPGPAPAGSWPTTSRLARFHTFAG